MTSVATALRTFLRLALPYLGRRDRWVALSLLAGIVAAELGLVAVLVGVNEWNKRFFNTLKSRDWSAVQIELLAFCAIAVGAVAASMAQYFFGQRLLIRWRRWPTERFVSQWMVDGKHYRMRIVHGGIDNIHLRIANDVMIFLTAPTKSIGYSKAEPVIAQWVKAHKVTRVGEYKTLLIYRKYG